MEFSRANKMFNLITTLFTSGISAITDTFRDVQIAKIKESTATKSVVKELELERLENERQIAKNAKDIRIMTRDHWEIRVLVSLIAFPIALRSAFSEFDKIYHFGWNIPEISDWQLTIILSFFGLSVAKTGINAVTTLLLSRK